MTAGKPTGTKDPSLAVMLKGIFPTQQPAAPAAHDEDQTQKASGDEVSSRDDDLDQSKAPTAPARKLRTTSETAAAIAKQHGFTDRVDGRKLRQRGAQLNIRVREADRQRYFLHMKESDYPTSQLFVTALLDLWEEAQATKRRRRTSEN